MKTIAIYHKDCTDGTTAAAVVLRKYPDALLFPLGHGYEAHELEPLLTQAVIGDRILTVDCAIGVREFLAHGHAVTTIDHHAGAREEFEILAQKNKQFTFIFDNTKSGASLTWATLFPGERMPELIMYVEDQDLWTKKYGNDTKNISSVLYLLTNKPDETLKLFTAPIDVLKQQGSSITAYAELMIENSVTKTESIMVTMGEYHVPFYNITSLKSEAGNILCTTRNQTVALFTIDGEKVKISFRSLDSHTPSALDIAKIIGGGGHRNASGGIMTLSDFITRIVRPL